MVALAIAGFATDSYEVVGLVYFQDAIPGLVCGRFFSLFLLTLSGGGLLGALAVTLGVLALPPWVLAVAFGVARPLALYCA